MACRSCTDAGVVVRVVLRVSCIVVDGHRVFGFTGRVSAFTFRISCQLLLKSGFRVVRGRARLRQIVIFCLELLESRSKHSCN
jgi:hypothetical protein